MQVKLICKEEKMIRREEIEKEMEQRVERSKENDSINLS